MADDLKNFCVNAYKDILAVKRSELFSQGRQSSEAKEKALEIEARKQTIASVFMLVSSKYPNIESGEIWDMIHSAHVCDWSGISNIELVNKLKSAQQSWNKSSGHAFEEIIKVNASRALKADNIEIILQRDLSRLLNKGLLANAQKDLDWLKGIKSNTFDLYATISPEPGKTYCFGCIQSKTSVRERVGTDRGPSIEAMKAYFWSSIIVLNGDFMKMPEFVEMVNGGTKKFPLNGWHGMYVFSGKYKNDRIYPTNLDFANFKEDAAEAAEMWLKQRQWLSNEWKAQAFG